MSSEIVSILQVVRLGFKLSISFNTVACKVAAFGIDVHSIAKGLSLYVAALKQVGQNLQAKDSPHSPLALRIAKEISERGNTIFNFFAKMLDKAQRNDGDLIQERFARCFRKRHVTYLLALLDALKLSLIVMFQVLQLGKLISSKAPSSIPNYIVQGERDEVQNMLIVLHWSISRLDRLRYSAICEAEEYSRNARYQGLSDSQLNGSGPPPPSTIPTILPALSFKDLNSSLSPISQDVTGTVHVSSQAIDHLIAQWAQVGGFRGLSGEEARPQRHVTFASDVESNSFRDGLEGCERQKDHPEGATSNRRRHSQEARKPATEFRKDNSSLQAQVETDSEESSNNDTPATRKDNSSLQAQVETDSEESSDNDIPVRRRKVRFSPSGNTSATEEGGHHRGDGGHVNYTNKGKPKTSPSQRRIPTPEFNMHNQQTADRHPRPPRRSPRTLPRAIPEREPQKYGHISNLSPCNSSDSLVSGLYHPQYPSSTYLSSSPLHPTQRPSYPPQINTSNQLPQSPSYYAEHAHHHYQHHDC
ncbi:hypothetical protein BDBG_04607 [Blastomyces gilchristii SLH14081]|uniref:Uncharacterized protein n=1 Tax=Blastomyces gilchristii (strain SLH14081) TaxID=559298 RepID=A0A179UPT2_BLAGS|nr:uncharacterized protein BDBG_04607 [Blastomyces gilchristii SLH14081]OAT09031.1 hypothetical protein BDBG_04607 [Blastomyces gilchristii SLH14081]